MAKGDKAGGRKSAKKAKPPEAANAVRAAGKSAGKAEKPTKHRKGPPKSGSTSRKPKGKS